MALTDSIWDRVADLIDPPDDSGIWKPFPKQLEASKLAGTVDELLFGGAAGPGKTEWLMEYGIGQMERYDGNRGVIFRRVFPSLNRSIIPRLKAKLIHSGRAKWNTNEHTLTFPNGSVLECASLQYADDVYDYQGTEYGWMGFEELTEFLEAQYEHMLTRLRAPQDGIRPHVCSTTNPGGRGHRWVKRRFVRPKPEDLEDGEARPVPGQVWRPRFIVGRHDINSPPGLRVFVPATHRDNPKLLERDPGYLSRVLGMSNRGLRKAYETGDWDAIDAIEGALWIPDDLEGGRVTPHHFRDKVQVLRRVVAVDPSDGKEVGDEYGVAVVSRGMDGVGYTEASYSWKGQPRTLAMKTLELAKDVGADAIVVERNHGGKWLMEVFRAVDPYANVKDVWASQGKLTRAEPVAALFQRQPGNIEMPYRARMVGIHEELEEQMTTFTGLQGEVSPNELDALVWGYSELFGFRQQIRDREYDDNRLDNRR